MAHDSITHKNSPVTEESFDIARKLWKIVGIDEANAYEILDGDQGTQWYQDDRMKMPVDLVIDLGEMENVSGFKYFPNQHWWARYIKVSALKNTQGDDRVGYAEIDIMTKN